MEAKKKDEVRAIAEMLNRDLKTDIFYNDPTKLLSNVRGWLPSGALLLDLLSVDSNGNGGGLPLGRVIEIYGRPDVGKSTLAMGCISRSAVENNWIVFYIDKENSFRGNRALSLGLDPSKVIYMVPDTVESTFDYINKTMYNIRKRGIDRNAIFIWDTLARTNTEFQKKNRKTKIGDMALSVRSSIVSRLADTLPETNATLLILNHQVVRHIQTGATGSVGGSCLWHEASIRYAITFAPSSVIAKGDIAIGQRIKITTVESNLGPPRRSIILCLLYDSGIDDILSCIEFCRYHKTLKTSGSWYYLTVNKKDIKAQGIDAFKTKIVSTPGAIQALHDTTRATFFNIFGINGKGKK